MKRWETMDNLVSTMSVFPLLQCAAEEGIAVSDLLAGSQLTESLLCDHERTVPFDEECVVVSNYMRLTREPHPGLSASAHYHYNCFGVLGAALVSHPNMLEACRFLVRYVALTFTPFLVTTQEDELTLCARYLDRLDLGKCREYYLLRDLAFVRNLCREADPDHWQQLVSRMDIAMPEPADSQSIYDFFAWPIRFNADETLIETHKSALQQPLRLANPMTLELMVRQCDELLVQRQPQSWRARVESLLLQGVMDLQLIAEQCCCSERTLRRHLQREGSSFQEIALQLLQQRAMQYLKYSRLSVEVIANRLGYSETAAFAHAFKRWTGRTPSQYRTEAHD